MDEDWPPSHNHLQPVGAVGTDGGQWIRSMQVLERYEVSNHQFILVEDPVVHDRNENPPLGSQAAPAHCSPKENRLSAI